MSRTTKPERVAATPGSVVRPPAKFVDGDTLVATALKCRFTGKQFIVCASSRTDLSTILPLLSCAADKDEFRKVVLSRPNPGADGRGKESAR